MALNLCAMLIDVPLKAFSGAVLFGLQRLGYSARDLYLPFKVGGSGMGKRVLDWPHCVGNVIEDTDMHTIISEMTSLTLSGCSLTPKSRSSGATWRLASLRVTVLNPLQQQASGVKTRSLGSTNILRQKDTCAVSHVA